ncbi:hypothetical protein DSC45_04720 [Streptomyces sp. YIM 130001]|uniref:hypothetical protein n=1 Tax=Streptomyces sp. YIM 130001 TaxID=2259644 RepID=UPI000EE681C7|nr:hypothetical protein [Streptomyces sp. YIM 130001]RII20510.1 hypothetical protein DSC45_04720 [Streptomyces sp. YIM 130001]
MTDQQAAKPNPRIGGRPSLPRRVWSAIVRESAPPPIPRPAPGEEQLAGGHLAVGVIDDAIEDGPGSDVQGSDTLVISAEVPGQVTLHRRVTCPLPMPGSGRRLVDRTITFRHATLDPCFVNDVLVVRWPDEVTRALEPFRPTGPGALRARAWRFLSGCGAVIAVGGILLTVVTLIGVIFTGGALFADLPAWFRPGVALTASMSAAVLGPIAYVICESRVHRVPSEGRQ